MDWTAQLQDNLFDEADAEHITLSSDPLEDEIAQNAKSVTTRTFSQPGNAGKLTRGFTLCDGRFLAVCVEHPHVRTKRYQVDLAFLDPSARRFSGVAWRWLFVTLALAVIATVASGVSWVSGTVLLSQPWLPVDLLLVAATIMAFLVFLYRTSFTLTFHSLHGGTPLVELSAQSPTRAAVERFVVELQQQIEAARKVHWRNKGQFLRDELRFHNRLWEEGVLTDKTYEACKRRILAQHG